jgi:hypothetical protein
MVAETRYTNQDSTLVAVEELTVYRYVPAAESGVIDGPA